MKSIIIYFLTGGIVTVAIVLLEKSGYRLLSGIAALMPVFTLVSYIFIGESQGGIAVSKHSQFVLVGTLVTWVPYMLAISYLAPKVGAYKAIAIGMGVFTLLALIFVLIVNKYNLFK
ncbi:MAG TPA: GlpM family protein [Bacteroidia bacterium]|jgi:uncharacterized membrane protein (GlpM family)|nr:GlpM family protein [Bacteroidia bacterium]